MGYIKKKKIFDIFVYEVLLKLESLQMPFFLYVISVAYHSFINTNTFK